MIWPSISWPGSHDLCAAAGTDLLVQMYTTDYLSCLWVARYEKHLTASLQRPLNEVSLWHWLRKPSHACMQAVFVFCTSALIICKGNRVSATSELLGSKYILSFALLAVVEHSNPSSLPPPLLDLRTVMFSTMTTESVPAATVFIVSYKKTKQNLWAKKCSETFARSRDYCEIVCCILFATQI